MAEVSQSTYTNLSYVLGTALIAWGGAKALGLSRRTLLNKLTAQEQTHGPYLVLYKSVQVRPRPVHVSNKVSFYCCARIYSCAPHTLMQRLGYICLHSNRDRTMQSPRGNFPKFSWTLVLYITRLRESEFKYCGHCRHTNFINTADQFCKHTLLLHSAR